MASIDTCYISSGCNRTPHCLDWGQNNLICYGSCRAVAIYRPEGVDGVPGAILHTLTAHSDRVNCVTWIPKLLEGPEDEIVSGSVDKTAVVWKCKKNKFQATQVLSGHSGPVTAISAINVPVDTEATAAMSYRTVIVTASVDSSVKVWTRSLDQEFVISQTLTYGSGFILDMALTVIPNTSVVMLACAADDHKVHLYVEEPNEEKLQVITLTGHEDWVRAVDFTIDDCGDILLASAAQDYLIRVWRLSHRDSDTGKKIDSIIDLPLDKDIQMRENTISFPYKEKRCVYAVTLETVLSGHENWIYSVKWKPATLLGNQDIQKTWMSLNFGQISPPTMELSALEHLKNIVSPGGKPHQEMCLLSVSMDKTMILWRPDTESGVWMEQVRVGEVGGNTLGLYGGVFGPDGTSILAHGYQGAFHHWKQQQETDHWSHMVTAGGHFDSVEDIDWDRDEGNFLMSASLDETVRLHSPWVKEGRQPYWDDYLTSTKQWIKCLAQRHNTVTAVSWYELARPQVHGYALQCLAMVHRYRYASGADEKVIRVFDATTNFIENFCSICGIDISSESQKEEARNRPEGASVPALGLSNKAVFSEGTPPDPSEDMEIKPGTNEQYTDNVFTAISLKEPPSEEHLLQNTLWPEVQKLYGHGFEIFSLACDPQGKLLASSCKAAKAEFATVILWDTVTWQQVCTLEGHSLTVTQLTFSHSGDYLLSVSRDRTWCLYKRKTADQPELDPIFSKFASVDKKTCIHARIIWSCCWSHDDRYFATASRDKKVVIWPCPPDHTAIVPVSKLDVSDSATAVHMAPVHLPDSSYLLSVGLEKGHILLYKWSVNSTSPWQQLATLDTQLAHHLTVKKLRFRPCLGLAGIHGNSSESKVKDTNDWVQLASCGADHAVKLFNIHIPKLMTENQT